MVSERRSAVRIDAATDRPEAKLLGRHLDVTGMAQVPRVLIIIAAALGEWQNVIDDSSRAGEPRIKAPLAKTHGAAQPTSALALAGPAAKALNSMPRRHTRIRFPGECGPGVSSWPSRSSLGEQ